MDTESMNSKGMRSCMVVPGKRHVQAVTVVLTNCLGRSVYFFYGKHELGICFYCLSNKLLAEI